MLAHRLPMPQYETDAQFTRVLDFLHVHRDAVDEVCLFTEKTNVACWPLDRFADNAALIARRMDELRAAGVPRVGINFLSTLGHLDDADPGYPPMTLPVMVGHDGQRARMCPCPNTPEFRAYLHEKYRLMAAARPDFLWVDDDFRMQWHGVTYGCFCPTCLTKFGRGFTDRETLVARLNDPAGGEERRAWVEQNITTLEELATLIEEAVHGEDPNIELGLMNGGPQIFSYSGLALDRWLRALKGRRARPGGGFYDDVHPHGMLEKAFDIARQCNEYPPQVDIVQYELENFPCLPHEKSVQSVLNECTLALGAGCSELSFSAIPSARVGLDDYDPLFDALARNRSVWIDFAAQARPLSPLGAWIAYDTKLMANREITPLTPQALGNAYLSGDDAAKTLGDWFAPDAAYDITVPQGFAPIGLPMTGNPAASCLTLLAGRVAEGFSDAELRRILTGGVMLDGDALQVLWRRGLGELTGVRVAQGYTNAVHEVYADHPANAGAVGDERWISQAYYASTAWEFAPVAEGVEVVSRLQFWDDQRGGPCLTAYANPLGGRVVTMGYVPWRQLGTRAKRAQVLALADWAAQGRLPLLVDRPVRVASLVRGNAEGTRMAAVLLNTSYDPTGPLTLRFRATLPTVQQLDPAGDISLPVTHINGETHVTLPELMPWQAVMLVGA